MTQLDALGYPAGEEELASASRGEVLARAGQPLVRLWRSARAVPGIGTWLGVGICLAGVILLMVAWGRTAGLSDVSLQIPYVLSAGFTGLGLIVVGITVVNLQAKRADALAREKQLGELTRLLTELERLARLGVDDGSR